MKKSLQSLIVLLMALIMSVTATSAQVKLTDGVYQDGSTLYISSGVTSLGPLQVNPSVIYSFAATPPACVETTFAGYEATLHMPATSYGAYFVANYWGNFVNMYNDAVEPTGVTVSKANAEILVGNTMTLNAVVAPNNASLRTVLWTSTDPQVATVSSGGIVTALATGECDIVASCLDKQAVCHVTVYNPISVALDQTSVTIEQTQQVTLTATVSPEGTTGQSVTWATTDPSVATVNGGVVTGVGIGECDIIASYLDKQAVCHVTVVAATIYITLDMHEAKLLPNHALTITPTMSPLSTELKVTVSNPEVAAARLVNGVVQVVGLTEGSTMIVVSSTDGHAVPDACMVTVYTECGDVNCDGYVTIGDVTALIDYLLGGEVGTFSATNADTNRNGSVSIADVTSLIDYLLSGYWPWWEPEYVDLGLPSGTLWATCNVGANSPEEYGDYFAWGETEPNSYYEWDTYKWCNGSHTTMTKYCTDSSYGYDGFVDNKTELDSEDDAAYVNWGPSWRMPTTEQQRELDEKCSFVWTTQNGVKGRLFTGPNGNSLFLPAAGSRWYESLYDVGSYGRYWSRTLYSSFTCSADCLYFYSGDVRWSRTYRPEGHAVRAVRVPQN